MPPRTTISATLLGITACAPITASQPIAIGQSNNFSAIGNTYTTISTIAAKKGAIGTGCTITP